MYNTKFIVKYHDIQEELVLKLKNKTEEEYLENSDDEYEYSNKDIIDICDKLYRDELCSVFYAENIIDDKIDKGIQETLQIMLLNNDFKNIIEDIKKVIYSIETPNRKGDIKDDLEENFQKNVTFFAFIILFSQNVFYITHKCICQQLDTGIIDNNLLEELKKHSIDTLHNK
jgi:hypothetical protein